MAHSFEIISNSSSRISFKDTHREKASLNKTSALENIQVVCTSNQLFITGSYTETKFSKKSTTGKTALHVIGPFYNPLLFV